MIIELEENTVGKIEACLLWVEVFVNEGQPVPPWSEVERWRNKCLEALNEIHTQVRRTHNQVGPGRRYERISEEEGRRIGGLHIRQRARPETFHSWEDPGDPHP